MLGEHRVQSFGALWMSAGGMKVKCCRSTKKEIITLFRKEATRLCKILPRLIKACQTGSIKGRYIGESIRTIIDTIFYTKENYIPGLLLFLDYQKAFHSLEWDFIFNILDKIWFWPEVYSFNLHNYSKLYFVAMEHSSGFFE